MKVSAVVCRGMQQFPTTLEITERIRAIKLCKITKLDSLMHVRGLRNFGRAVQTDPTLLRHASAIMEQKKCWELLAQNKLV